MANQTGDTLSQTQIVMFPILHEYALITCIAWKYELQPHEAVAQEVERLQSENMLPDRDLSKERVQEFFKSEIISDVWQMLRRPKAKSGSGSKRKGEEGTKHNWDDPMDAQWRMDLHREGWVQNKTGFTRRIKVYHGAADGWKDLMKEPTEELLRMYDGAILGAERFGLIVDRVKGLSYNYRYEGGQWLTQTNPNRTNKRRACQVYYGASWDEEW